MVYDNLTVFRLCSTGSLPAGLCGEVPFDLTARATGWARGQHMEGELSYTQELPAGQSVFTQLTGFGSESKDFDIRVENKKVGAGVRGEEFTAMEDVFCPSGRCFLRRPYINMKIEPGRSSTGNSRTIFHLCASKMTATSC